jgi:hypothetical protein
VRRQPRRERVRRVEKSFSCAYMARLPRSAAVRISAQFCRWSVDGRRPPDYISRIRRAVAFGAMARLRSSSLISVNRLPIVIGGLRLRRSSGSPEGGTVLVPGCLTGESEERETWTAESLRAASSNAEGFAKGLLCKRIRPDETFGGTRFRSTLWTCGGRRKPVRARTEWDLVNVAMHVNASSVGCNAQT